MKNYETEDIEIEGDLDNGFETMRGLFIGLALAAVFWTITISFFLYG